MLFFKEAKPLWVPIVLTTLFIWTCLAFGNLDLAVIGLLLQGMGIFGAGIYILVVRRTPNWETLPRRVKFKLLVTSYRR